MENLDLCYICTQIGDLSGVPIRIFRGGESVFFHAIVELPVDPARLYADALMDIRERVGYFATEDFQYYGVVRAA